MSFPLRHGCLKATRLSPRIRRPALPAWPTTALRGASVPRGGVRAQPPSDAPDSSVDRASLLHLEPLCCPTTESVPTTISSQAFLAAQRQAALHGGLEDHPVPAPATSSSSNTWTPAVHHHRNVTSAQCPAPRVPGNESRRGPQPSDQTLIHNPAWTCSLEAKSHQGRLQGTPQPGRAAALPHPLLSRLGINPPSLRSTLPSMGRPRSTRKPR